MTPEERGHVSNDHHGPTTPFINFAPKGGRQRAFQTAYLQVIEYSEEPRKIVLVWSTDVVTIKGTPETLQAIHEALLNNRCKTVICNGNTVTSLEIEPIEKDTQARAQERDPFA